MSWKKAAASLICLTSSTLLYAVDVGSEGALNIALTSLADPLIRFDGDITLSGNLFPVNSDAGFGSANVDITITTTPPGSMFDLDGTGGSRGFFIRGGTGSVRIENIRFKDTAAVGGAGGIGGFGGGAGAGFGGAVFINTGAVVTIANGAFDGANAAGGTGGLGANGSDAGAGGGGLHGTGGSTASGTAGGAGGGGGLFGNGGFGNLGFGFNSAFAGGGGGGGFIGSGGIGGSVGAIGGGGGATGLGGGGGGGSQSNLTGGGGGGGGGGTTGPGGTASATPTTPGMGGTGSPSGSGGGIGQTPTMGMGGAGGGGGSGTGGGGSAGGPGTGGGGGAGGNANASGFGGGGGGSGDTVTNSSGGNGGNGNTGGGGGGAGGNAFFALTGGNGGDFGGGGGGSFGCPGGSGGFGGGGGAGGSTNTGGTGGFGGGGGGGPTAGTSLFGGGSGDTFHGGGGAGFGGALFLQGNGSGMDNGAQLTLEDSVSFSGSSVMPGAGGGGGATAGSTAGTDIYMVSGSKLTFDITSNATLNYPIEGNIGAGGEGNPSLGGLLKKGPALLQLTGENTYSGQTDVSSGELRISSSVITPIFVGINGVLSGDFTAKFHPSIPNSGSIINAGRVSPGVNGVGTIMMDGIYGQTSSGTLRVDLTPDGTIHDRIMGAASADLKGTLDVVLNPGNYIAGTQYVVIDAPTNMTEFETVIETGGFGKLIDIDVAYSSVIVTILNTMLFEQQNIASGPPSDVVKCIKAAKITPNSDFAIAVEILGLLNDKQVNKALTSLSAVNYGAFEWINARNNSYVADILSQHLFELCCSPRECCNCCCADCNASLWAAGFGNFMDNRKRLDYLSPFKANAGGVIVGLDFCCGPCFYYGGAVGYTHTDLSVRKIRGSGDSNSYYGALYGSWVCDCFSLDLSVLGGGSDNDFKRKISYGTQTASVNRKAKSDFWNYFVTAHLGLRGSWNWCGCFEPFAVADYHYYTHGNFTEKGADSLNLRVRCKDQHMMRAEAGFKWYYEIDCDCYCWAPYLGGSYVGEFPLHKSKQPASFKGQSCVIDATSYDSNVHLGSPQAGVKWTHCCGFSFLLGYKGLFNCKTRINEVEGRIEWVF